MSATTGSEARSGIGARLRAGRERMGMTLLQVAEKLHVDPKVPESLEAECFDALGAPVYAKGHLRHYAELIGESTPELLDLYGAATKPAAPDLTQIPKANRRTSDPRKLVVPSLVVLIAFALVGMVWWILQGMQVGSPATPNTISETLPAETPPAVESGSTAAATAPATTSSPAGTAAPTGTAGAAGTAAAAGAATAAGTGAAARRAATPLSGSRAPVIAGAKIPASASTATASSTKTPAAAAAAASAQSTARALAPHRGTPAPAALSSRLAVTGTAQPLDAASTNTTGADSARGRTIDVTLKFASDSWVEVYDANGTKLFYEIGAAASSRKLTGTPPLRVTFGNAPGVTLAVNGKAVRVPANAVQNDTAQFVINRSGRIVRARSPTDGG